jgi:hypothetical protein
MSQENHRITHDVNDFHLKTPKTKLNCSRLNLLYNNWGDFDYFEDKVKFDVDILPSAVSLKDISLFAPDIEGMDANVLIKAKVSNRICDLSISDLDLRFGKKTVIQGNLILPDFRKEGAGNLNEEIRYANLDFEDLKPKSKS